MANDRCSTPSGVRHPAYSAQPAAAAPQKQVEKALYGTHATRISQQHHNTVLRQCSISLCRCLTALLEGSPLLLTGTCLSVPSLLAPRLVTLPQVHVQAVHCNKTADPSSNHSHVLLTAAFCLSPLPLAFRRSSQDWSPCPKAASCCQLLTQHSIARAAKIPWLLLTAGIWNQEQQ